LAADEGAAVPNATKTEIKHKEDRHVGLDFYDLLIEAIEAAAEATKLSELMGCAGRESGRGAEKGKKGSP